MLSNSEISMILKSLRFLPVFDDIISNEDIGLYISVSVDGTLLIHAVNESENFDESFYPLMIKFVNELIKIGAKQKTKFEYNGWLCIMELEVTNEFMTNCMSILANHIF